MSQFCTKCGEPLRPLFTSLQCMNSNCKNIPIRCGYTWYKDSVRPTGGGYTVWKTDTKPWELATQFSKQNPHEDYYVAPVFSLGLIPYDADGVGVAQVHFGKPGVIPDDAPATFAWIIPPE